MQPSVQALRLSALSVPAWRSCDVGQASAAWRSDSDAKPLGNQSRHACRAGQGRVWHGRHEDCFKRTALHIDQCRIVGSTVELIDRQGHATFKRRRAHHALHACIVKDVSSHSVTCAHCGSGPTACVQQVHVLGDAAPPARTCTRAGLVSSRCTVRAVRWRHLDTARSASPCMVDARTGAAFGSDMQANQPVTG